MTEEEKRTAAVIALKHLRELTDAWWDGTADQQRRLDPRIAAAEGVVLNMVNGFFPDDVPGLVDLNVHQRLDALEAQVREMISAHALHNNALVDGQNALGRRVEKLETDDLPQIAAALEEIRRLTLTPATPEHLPFGLQPNPPNFPTGAATTVDEALSAVPPVETRPFPPEADPPGDTEHENRPPRRGDRVRLEGAINSVGSLHIPDGWYDVTGEGSVTPTFQIRVRDAELGMQGIDTPAQFTFVRTDHPGIKEVRYGAANLDT